MIRNIGAFVMMRMGNGSLHSCSLTIFDDETWNPRDHEEALDSGTRRQPGGHRAA